MNRLELVEAISRETKLPKRDAAKFISAFISVISTALKEGDDVSLVGFGSFKVQHRAAREGINPLTKERIVIPGSHLAVFKMSRSFRTEIKKAWGDE